MISHAVESTIQRRLLVNYRIEPDLVAALLPRPFRPQLVSGWAVAGVCFIRLGGLRLAHMPSALGVTTENVAHRFAVEWDGGEGTQVGVYVPRRDTDSRLTSLAGGRVFPGHHWLATFNVREQGPDLHITVASRDSVVGLAVTAREARHLGGSLFGSIDDAVDFFRRGSSGYSPAERSGSRHLEGVRLVSERWDARPVTLEHMASSVFDDETLFPPGTCILDSGLVMRDLPVTWRRNGMLPCGSPVTAVTRG
jgi:hypothetical protein